MSEIVKQNRLRMPGRCVVLSEEKNLELSCTLNICLNQVVILTKLYNNNWTMPV